MKFGPTAIEPRSIVGAIAVSIGVSLIAIPAYANSWPPMAVPFFYLPLIASIFSFGIGFILLVLLETWILKQRESVLLGRSFRLVAEANLLSTLAGLAVVIIMTGLPSLFILPTPSDLLVWNVFLWYLLFWGILILFFLGVGICTAGFLKRLTPFGRGNFILWGVAWMVVLFADLVLLGIIGEIVYTPGLLITGLKLLGVATYFSIGFILSLVIEGFWLARHLSKTSTLGTTILLMNIRSYAYIVIPITIAILIEKLHL